MSAALNLEPYLNILPSALIVVDSALSIRYLNHAAEMLIGTSAHSAIERNLSAIGGFGSELCQLCQRVIASSQSISLYEHTLKLPMNYREVTIHISPVIIENEPVTQALITIEKSEGRDRVAAQELKQEASRAAGVMAAMLAHEVKNPLAGIRGAAQLLRDEVSPEHQSLTDLICMEADRIRDLLAQVEIFDDSVSSSTQSVNIHEVLQYVLSIAKTGFAPNITFKERYDPSLPPVIGHRDLLVQLLLNLVKNAAEALNGIENPTITFTTAYRSGYHIRSHNDERVSLPIMVSVEDNGVGIPENMRGRLFEPFVSSKEDGRGLGLAIVAKIATDLGAAVELDPEYERGTRFVLWLPVDSKG
jgi:two-component system nitrogen regulation sensor histidine kinase GlnL